MKNKDVFLFFLLVIILQGCILKSDSGKDIDCLEKNKSKNPIPVAPVASYYHIWGDQLYFVISNVVYLYDISNKLEITYVNEANLSKYYLERTDHFDPFPQIIFYEDMVIAISQNTRIDEKFNIKIDIWDLTTNDIVKNKSIEYIRDDKAKILCNYQEKLVICDYWFHNLFLIDLGQVSPTEEQIGINNETFNFSPKAILDENTLYLWDKNYDDSYEFISGNLLTYNIEELNNPLLVSNWTTTETEAKNYRQQKVGDILYLKRYNKAVALNITDTTNITEIGIFQISSEEEHYIEIFNHYAIVVHPFNISIFDISEIESSVKLGNYTDPFELIVWPEIFGVFDELIFASNVYEYETMILDWSNPENIIRIDFTLPDPSSITINTDLECRWIILSILPTFTFVYRQKRKKK